MKIVYRPADVNMVKMFVGWNVFVFLTQHMTSSTSQYEYTANINDMYVDLIYREEQEDDSVEIVYGRDSINLIHSIIKELE